MEQAFILNEGLYVQSTVIPKCTENRPSMFTRPHSWSKGSPGSKLGWQVPHKQMWRHSSRALQLA